MPLKRKIEFRLGYLHSRCGGVSGGGKLIVAPEAEGCQHDQVQAGLKEKKKSRGARDKNGDGGNGIA